MVYQDSDARNQTKYFLVEKFFTSEWFLVRPRQENRAVCFGEKWVKTSGKFVTIGIFWHSLNVGPQND